MLVFALSSGSIMCYLLPAIVPPLKCRAEMSIDRNVREGSGAA
jgi:hypothetical protein